MVSVAANFTVAHFQVPNLLSVEAKKDFRTPKEVVLVQIEGSLELKRKALMTARLIAIPSTSKGTAIGYFNFLEVPEASTGAAKNALMGSIATRTSSIAAPKTFRAENLLVWLARKEEDEAEAEEVEVEHCEGVQAKVGKVILGRAASKEVGDVVAKVDVAVEAIKDEEVKEAFVKPEVGNVAVEEHLP